LLKTRVLTILILLPVFAFLMQFGEIPFWLTITAIVLVATWEFIQMMRQKEHRPSVVLAMLFALVPMITTQWGAQSALAPMLMLLLVASLVWQLFQQSSAAPVVDWALTVVGGLYIGFGMSHLVGLRMLPNGFGWAWLALLTTWGSDSFAYLIGKNFGKIKFWPRLSPKKTWEGFLGGIPGGLMGAWMVAFSTSVPWGHAMIVGVLVSLIGPFGDLSISMMKRYAGVKDSSHLIPGHGGVLDRIDSVLFVVVTVFYYVTWIVV